MKRLLIAALVPLTLLMGGCRLTGPDHGTIYAKSYTPYRHWQTQGGYAYTCLPGFDGKMDCKYKYSPYVVEDHYQDECYEVDFRDENDDSGSACVTAAEYDRYAIGDYYGQRP